MCNFSTKTVEVNVYSLDSLEVRVFLLYRPQWSECTFLTDYLQGSVCTFSSYYRGHCVLVPLTYVPKKPTCTFHVNKSMFLLFLYNVPVPYIPVLWRSACILPVTVLDIWGTVCNILYYRGQSELCCPFYRVQKSALMWIL